MAERITPSSPHKINAEYNQFLQEWKSIMLKIAQKLNETIENYQNKVKELELMQKELFDSVLIELFNIASPNLLEINYVGYTPAWNDGDVCTHSGTFGYNLYNDYLDYGDDEFQSTGVFEELSDCPESVRIECERLNKLTWAKDINNFHDLFYKTLDQIDAELYLLKKFDTDFYVSYRLVDGKIVSESGQYNPEY